MALKSEQARVLRRRVLGGLIRNLLLFSGAFALACLAIETFMVPSIANWVADSTSSWRTLNSSEQFQQILTDQGLLDDANLFDLWVNEAVESGYSNDAGTIAEVQGEVNEMEDALAEYASMMADSPENAEAAAAYAKERAEKLGADVAVASGTNAAAIGDTSTFIDDVAPLDAETDGAPDDKTLRAVPLLPYQTILTAEGIFTDEAPMPWRRCAYQHPCRSWGFPCPRPKRSCRRRPRWTWPRGFSSAPPSWATISQR